MVSDAPKVGVGLLVLRDDGRMLLSLRKNTSHGQGTWGAAGGHLEFGETFEECALRELREEAGDITVANLRFGTVSNDIYSDAGRHYVTILMLADHVSGDPEVREPEKFERWEWFRRQELPDNLFPALRTIFGSGFDPHAI